MTRAPASAIAPDGDLILELAHAAIEALPEPYRVAARAVALRIDDFAELELLDALQIEDPYELTGLYDGVPLTEKVLSDPAPQHDQIFLYRRPILEEWIERGDVSLGEMITHVMVHELAHHFGWTDEEIASIDPWWE
jgi:predicted Zn-dependent protease with MMP-like domain